MFLSLLFLMMRAQASIFMVTSSARSVGKVVCQLFGVLFSVKDIFQGFIDLGRFIR